MYSTLMLIEIQDVKAMAKTFVSQSIVDEYMIKTFVSQSVRIARCPGLMNYLGNRAM